jgi:hypothetical protein
MKIELCRDILNQKSDCLIHSLDLLWPGLILSSIDFEIKKLAGKKYHSQIKGVLSPNEIILARGDGSFGFGDIVFVVDSLEDSVSEIVFRSLIFVNEQRYNNVSISLSELKLFCVYLDLKFDRLYESDFVISFIEGIKKYLDYNNRCQFRNYISKLNIHCFNNDIKDLFEMNG